MLTFDDRLFGKISLPGYPQDTSSDNGAVIKLFGSEIQYTPAVIYSDMNRLGSIENILGSTPTLGGCPLSMTYAFAAMVQ